MSHSSSLSSIAANLAAHFSADALLAPRDLDATLRAWELDSPDPAPFDDADWSEYAEWSRSLDGGCGVTELSPDERDLIAHSASESDYWDSVFAEYDAHHDFEQTFADAPRA